MDHKLWLPTFIIQLCSLTRALCPPPFFHTKKTCILIFLLSSVPLSPCIVLASHFPQTCFENYGIRNVIHLFVQKIICFFLILLKAVSSLSLSLFSFTHSLFHSFSLPLPLPLLVIRFLLLWFPSFPHRDPTKNRYPWISIALDSIALLTAPWLKLHFSYCSTIHPPDISQLF